jgi:hypothetical protein
MTDGNTHEIVENVERKFSPPEGLSDREIACYRLGLIDFMLKGVEDGDLKAPSAIFMHAFNVERSYRLQQLEESAAQDAEYAALAREVEDVMSENASARWQGAPGYDS